MVRSDGAGADNEAQSSGNIPNYAIAEQRQEVGWRRARARAVDGHRRADVGPIKHYETCSSRRIACKSFNGGGVRRRADAADHVERP
jgi:hypothetical protein